MNSLVEKEKTPHWQDHDLLQDHDLFSESLDESQEGRVSPMSHDWGVHQQFPPQSMQDLFLSTFEDSLERATAMSCEAPPATTNDAPMEPEKPDVVGGRGKTTHQGNRLFHAMIRTHCANYKKEQGGEKGNAALVALIRNTFSRFLVTNDKGEQVELSEESIKKKICQALRDGQRKIGKEKDSAADSAQAQPFDGSSPQPVNSAPKQNERQFAVQNSNVGQAHDGARSEIMEPTSLNSHLRPNNMGTQTIRKSPKIASGSKTTGATDSRNLLVSPLPAFLPNTQSVNRSSQRNDTNRVYYYYPTPDDYTSYEAAIDVSIRTMVKEHMRKHNRLHQPSLTPLMNT